MLVPSFQLTLTDPIREKRAAVGQLYEGHACFACATTGGQASGSCRPQRARCAACPALPRISRRREARASSPGQDRHVSVSTCRWKPSLARRPQILVYNPNETPGAEMNRSQYIRVNRDITALASGRMLTDGSKKEHLFIGTSSSVQAFDCEQNRDLFYADVADGATGAGARRRRAAMRVLRRRRSRA